MVNDGIGNGNFTTLKPFAFWTQHVLPLVYGDEISYMETLGKIRDILNELIKNNNNLPEYIQRMIEEYITGGPLEEVLRGILADFILNVKYPPMGITPAKGDGTANDYEAIQGCIDYAASKGGGVVYFPFGKYLTSKLTLKPNVSLMGFGKYCTSIVLTGGETDALLSGTVTDCGIYNMTLDANMGIQVNNVDVLTLTGSNIQLMNVILTDGYSLFNIEKTGDNIELNNVEFRYAVESMLRIGGTVGTLNANSIKFGNLSTIKGVAAIISDSNNDVITGIVSNDILPLFAQLDGNNNVLKGVVASTNVLAGTGQNNVYDFYGRTKDETYTGDVSETYTGDVSETVHGSKSTHIDTMSTWAVDGNSTESVDGTKSEIVTGVSSAQYNEDRTVNGKNFTEIMSGKKVINSQDIILNPTNPLTYKTPTDLDRNFKSVKMKDDSGVVYDVLVYKTPITGYNIFDTLSDAITSNLPVGTAFQTLGYLTKNDGGGLQYIITTGGNVDGGSVVKYGTNTATAIMPDGVYPEYFGVSPTNATQWNNYLNYVNTTEGKYFRLYTKTYTIPVIFIAFKSIIGNEDYSNNIANITSASTLGVVSATQTTYLNYSLNTSCVVCCYNKNRSAELGHITFKNFTVTANGEQTAIFLADVSHFNMDNVLAKGGTESCFYIQGAWLCYFNNLNAQPNGSYGIVVGNVPRVESTGTTTCTFNSCFVESLSNTTAVCGWYFNGANSMTLNSCACDHIAGNANAYIFNYSEATLNACSVEDYRGNNALFNIYDSQISVNSFFGSNNKNASSIFLVRTRVTLTINGIKYTGTVTKPAVNIVYGTTDSTGIVVCNYNTAQLTNVSLPVYCETTSTLHFYYKNEQEHGRYITNAKTLVTYA